MNAPPVIAPADADRLAKLAGMLASDQDGERASAALLATRHLSRMGLTWRDLVERAATSTRSSAAPAWSPPAPPDDRAQLGAVMRCLSRLSPWERQFCDHLLNWRGAFTPRQRAKLRAIYATVVRAGAA